MESQVLACQCLQHVLERRVLRGAKSICLHRIWEMVTLERRKHTNRMVERTMYLDKYYWQGFLFVWDGEFESVP